jgi:hypothetical protein
MENQLRDNNISQTYAQNRGRLLNLLAQLAKSVD